MSNIETRKGKDCLVNRLEIRSEDRRMNKYKGETV